MSCEIKLPMILYLVVHHEGEGDVPLHSHVLVDRVGLPPGQAHFLE